MSQTTTESDTTFQIDDDGHPSTTVVEAVAEAEDADPLDLTPLYSAVETDALDSLFASLVGDDGPAIDEVTFSYHGYDVTVTGDGFVHLDG